METKYWSIEDSYPGLVTRYHIAVVPGKTLSDAKLLANKLGFLKHGMPYHIREATRDELINFVNKTAEELERARSLKTLMHLLDAALTEYFPDAP